MSLSELIEEFRELGEEISRRFANFKKDGPARKTAIYKQKRNGEIEAIWKAYLSKIAEIEKLLKQSDPCFEEDKTKYNTVYKEFTEALAKIPDNGSYSEEDAKTMEADLLIQLKKQDVRFESLRKSLEEVEDKINQQVEWSSAFGKLKNKQIGEIWNRITIADEELVVDRETLPQTYTDKMNEYTQSVENVLLFIQKSLEVNRPKGETEGVKLNRIKITRFDGDYFKWVSFKDLFTSMVLKNKSLSKVQKMQVLKTSVGGEAETLIADLTISEANFESAWYKLLGRYDNNRIVVYKHLNKLLDQPVARTESKAVKTLFDTTDQILMALKNLGRQTEAWDDWIVLIIAQKLSEECRRDWEKKIGNTTELPTWSELKQFLEEEFRMLEGIENGNRRGDSKKSESKTPEKTKDSIKSYHASIDEKVCPVCKEEHKLFDCSKFKNMDVKERFEMAKKNKLCFGCLRMHNRKQKCEKGKKPCKKCDRRHSTWLHENRAEEPNVVANAHGTVSVINKGAVSANVATITQVLLATATVLTNDIDGRSVSLRALIDSGSQGSMITDKAAAMLQLKSTKSDKYINGLGENNTGAVKKVMFNIRPRFESEFELEIECYILKKLTKTLPDHELCIRKWQHIQGLVLADPTFNKVGPIDLLLGMDVVAQIMRAGLIKGEIGKPMAQETSLGWIISGNIDPTYPRNTVKCLVSTKSDKEDDLSRFWELEELHPKRSLTYDEQLCEEFFQKNHSRDAKGKFTVKIPFKPGNEGPGSLGASKGQCMARFLQLEKKLEKDEELRKEYVRVMEEYKELGHMKMVNDDTQKLYYIPHHAVIKPDSLTTKTRVVFDASAKTSTGKSLNEGMWIGGKQQEDLFDILTRWRKHEIVFKADIEKMYRKIELDADDQRYHTILWRKDPTEQIKEYQLTTVTFGTAAAPFLATRTLKQLAIDHRKEYPVASDIIQQDFYVDDLISGCNSLREAIRAKDELIQTLQKGDMHLRKWTSNSAELLKLLPSKITEKSLQMFNDDETTKALGLSWNPKTDEFNFKVTWDRSDNEITKRRLLSEASKLFDPLGWLAPVVIVAKMLMQEVWLAEIKWDDEVPENVSTKWRQFKMEISQLETIAIQRWLRVNPECEISVHGFCDASEKAYAALVYTRVRIGSEVYIKMIASKTRVAAVRKKLTLPKLELCGAVLLGALLKATKEALKLENVPTYAWSDSMVTLGWIKGNPSKWKTFVANRVAEIQASTINTWSYVKSEDNPADCASRGIMPSELEHHPLWWTGPGWLREEPESWTEIDVEEPTLEKRGLSVNLAVLEGNETINRSSSWTRLVRFTAYARRMKNRRSGFLTSEELEMARSALMKKCQEEAFPYELRSLKENQPISKKSNILSLNPFMDDSGLLRVGGRLTNAKMTFDNKHPIILPARHHVTKLIIRQCHLDTLHGGPQLMRNIIQKRYWIIQGKRNMNNEYSKCVVCRRFNGKTHEQRMGNLPEVRVTLERGFLHTAVDYAGPVELKSSKLRNAKVIKTWIALFICMATKAIHLELVSDLTTEAFLAAFNRFMARRGLVTTMYSDNGTTFVGGANQLTKEEQKLLHGKNMEVAQRIASKGVNWKFIPPGTPNFGGLWERGVRSTKDHLKRTLKTARLTFEEYNTVLCQVEACLNSRPLCALTEDRENFNVLTPGHFLIGDALSAPPQPALLDITVNKVKRWKHVQLLQQHFWNRWNQDYLTQLQQSQKWEQTSQNIQKGDMVAIKDEDLPPRNWLVGRIEDTHPGTDGEIRVASVRIADPGYPKTKKIIVIKRPVRKLCPLVSHEENDQPGRPSKRSTSSGKWNMGAAMLISLIVMLLLDGLMANPMKNAVTIQPFEHNAGIYFEYRGKAQMIKSNWHSILYFDLKDYFHEIERLNDFIVKLRTTCNNITEDSGTHCIEIVAQLFERIIQMKQLNKVIKSNKKLTNNHRTKRAAPLGIVGWVQHELFGVMDEAHAESLEDQIDTMNGDVDHMAQLIKNQTTIIDSTLGLVKTTQDDINRNYGKLHRIMDELNNQTDLLRRGEQILGWALHASLLMDKIERIQQKILSILTEIQQGHLNSYVFPPEQLQEQLVMIKQHLPSGCQLPESPEDDLRSFYDLVHGKTRVTEKKLIIDLTVPLISTTEYQVFHIIPVPTNHNGERVAIIPESEYLLTTLKRDSFYQMSKEEFNECVKLPEDTSMCRMLRQIKTVESTASQCERDLLAQKTEISKHCKVQVTKHEDVWIQLHDRNNWIYDLQTKVTLNIVCKKEAHTMTIQGSGILTIQAGCEVSYQGNVMVAESTVSSSRTIDFSPMMNLSDVITTNHTRLKLDNLTINHDEEMKNLYLQLDEVKTQTEWKVGHHVAHYGMGTSTMIMMITIFVLIFYKRKKLMTIITSTINGDHYNDENGVSSENNLETIHIDLNTNSKIENSDDNSASGKSSTAERHKAGECPFRK